MTKQELKEAIYYLKRLPHEDVETGNPLEDSETGLDTCGDSECCLCKTIKMLRASLKRRK